MAKRKPLKQTAKRAKRVKPARGPVKPTRKARAAKHAARAKRGGSKRASGPIAKSAGKRSRIANAGGRRRRPSAKKARSATIVKGGVAGQPRKRAAKKNSRRVLLKWKKPRRGKANPAQGAKAQFEKFHGKPSTKAIDYKTAVHSHAHLAEAGKLSYLKVIMPDDFPMEAVELRPKGVTVAMSEDGGQIYFLGGDQTLNLAKLGMAGQLPKDHVVIGPVFEIEYVTQKEFDGFKTLNYFHEFGEEGGELPTLCYDVRSKLMYLVGGSYQCLAPGITD